MWYFQSMLPALTMNLFAIIPISARLARDDADNFDRTLAPNRALIRRIKDTANTLHKPLQLDMFNGGGTDGGEAHKSRW